MKEITRGVADEEEHDARKSYSQQSLSPPQKSLSSVGRNREREIKASGSWGKGKRQRAGTPARPRFFNKFPVTSLFPPFSRRFPTEGASAEEKAAIPRVSITTSEIFHSKFDFLY